jgi:hypothetical protein
VFTTALTWWVGIVWLATDFAFTVTNVVAHGVPYMFMSQRVSAAPPQAQPNGLMRQLTAYAVTLLALAFVEEWLWDVAVWQEHADIFPTFPVEVALLGPLVVPLLAVPQITHYVLDAYLWRLDGHNPGVARVVSESHSVDMRERIDARVRRLSSDSEAN